MYANTLIVVIYLRIALTLADTLAHSRCFVSAHSSLSNHASARVFFTLSDATAALQDAEDNSAVTVALNARHQLSMQSISSGSLLRPFEDVVSLIIDHPAFNASEANCPSYACLQLP